MSATGWDLRRTLGSISICETRAFRKRLWQRSHDCNGLRLWPTKANQQKVFRDWLAGVALESGLSERLCWISQGAGSPVVSNELLSMHLGAMMSMMGRATVTVRGTCTSKTRSHDHEASHGWTAGAVQGPFEEQMTRQL